MPDLPTRSIDSAGNHVPSTASEEHMFKRKLDAEYTREQRYEENKKKAYALLYKHCAAELKALLKGDDSWGSMEAQEDSISLLWKIKVLCCKFHPTKKETRAIVAADKAIMCYVQEAHVMNSQYFEHFNAMVDTALNYGSSIGHSRALVSAELVKMGTYQENATTAQKSKAMELAQESYLSMLMLDGANYCKFKTLWEELDNDYAKGRDTYPTNQNAVLWLLNGRKTPTFQRQHNNPSGSADNIKSSNVERKGTLQQTVQQKSWESPAKEDDNNGEHMHTMPAVESDSEGSGSNKDSAHETEDDMWEAKGLSHDWLLLDSQSSTDMFYNRKYLKEVRAAVRPTTIHCNAGSTGILSTEEFGDIPVKYRPTGICNVISLKTMQALFPISHINDPRNPKAATFQVKMPQGIIEFKPCSKGLHYFDLSGTTQMVEMHVQTVQHNFEGFSRDQVLRTIKAWKLQAMLGSPAKVDFKGMVRGKPLDDCPVVVVDLWNAHTTFGPDLAGLQGRTVRSRPERVRTEIVAIPWDFVRLHKFVVLTADIMFVNGIPFLLTRSRGIQLITVEFLPRRMAKIIGAKLT
eukprot:CCRYP_001377-RA/>CCRYP_001377-RA protein AED:0.71 eAED:0.39 QI:0/0/0/0.66/0/0/3/0/576